MLKITSVFGFLALTGCAASTGYQPMGFKGGYVDKMTSADTAVVGFGGNSFTDGTTLVTMLFLRCAELTLEHGYRYFVVTAASPRSPLQGPPSPAHTATFQDWDTAATSQL